MDPASLCAIRFDLDGLLASPSTLVASISVPPLPTTVQKRCGQCRHKLLLTDMECKCGVRHCSKHRLPEDHACSFHHGAHAKRVLEKSLQSCVSDKMSDRL